MHNNGSQHMDVSSKLKVAYYYNQSDKKFYAMGGEHMSFNASTYGTIAQHYNQVAS